MIASLMQLLPKVNELFKTLPDETKEPNMNDKNMRSVQGHVCMLKQQTPLDYMILIYLGEDENNLGQKRKKSVYYMPKSSGVIGGTFIEDADSQTPNEEEFDQLISNARLFFGRS